MLWPLGCFKRVAVELNLSWPAKDAQEYPDAIFSGPRANADEFREWSCNGTERVARSCVDDRWRLDDPSGITLAQEALDGEGRNDLGGTHGGTKDIGNTGLMESRDPLAITVGLDEPVTGEEAFNACLCRVAGEECREAGSK